MLAAVAGVYLIVDRKTGKQYVGSASGEGGILSRWRSYADTGHGGNKRLIDLAACDPEGLYKEKLGSRAFGLNSN